MIFLKVLSVLLIWQFFWPNQTFGNQKSYLLAFDFSKISSTLYDEQKTPILSYGVCLPRITPEVFPIWGKIIKIKRDPDWNPSEPTRKWYFNKYRKELPEHLKPGDPQNAMGKVKFFVKFLTPGVNPINRIHGTNDPTSIGKRISRNCIRFENPDIISIADLIEKNDTSVLYARDTAQIQQILKTFIFS